MKSEADFLKSPWQDETERKDRMKKRVVPLRLLLEQRRRQREVLDNLDWLAAHSCISSHRKKIWTMREELKEMLLLELSLKVGRLP